MVHLPTAGDLRRGSAANEAATWGRFTMPLSITGQPAGSLSLHCASRRPRCARATHGSAVPALAPTRWLGRLMHHTNSALRARLPASAALTCTLRRSPFRAVPDQSAHDRLGPEPT